MTSSARIRRCLVLALAWGAALAAGCASNELRPLEEEEAFRRIRSDRLEAMPVRVALAPVQLTYEPSPPKADPSKGRWSVELDRRGRDAIQSEFEAVLSQDDLFRDLVVLPRDADDTFQAAWEAEADLLLEIDVHRYDVAYEERTGWYVPNILLWAYFWIPSWWVADERFRSEVDVTARLTSVHTGDVVWERTYEESALADLDDFERGWMIFGIFRMPGAFDEENWKMVDGVVSRHAVRKGALDLYADLQDDFRSFTRGAEFRRRMTKTLALLIGVTKYRYRKIRNIGYADRDAEGLRGALTDPGAGGVIPQNVLVLIDEQATRGRILAALDEFLARRSSSLDSVIIYFAGNAAAVGESRLLLPWDFDPDDPAETALDMASVAKALDDIPARNLVTILDCSFQGEIDGRCFPLPGKPTEPIDDAFVQGLASDEGRWVLLGALPTQSANEHDPVQKGIFSHFLIEGLLGLGDADRDGAVDLGEAFEFVLPRVTVQSQLSTGRDQTPRLFPEPGTGIAKPSEFRITAPGGDSSPPG